MPFGFYKADITEKKKKPKAAKKPKPVNKPKVNPIKTNLPKPPVKKVEKPFEPDILPAIPEVMVNNVMNISILVAGRSVSEAVDMIAGVEKTTNEVIQNHGMSLFSTDNQMSSDLFSRQTKLKQLAADDRLKYNDVLGGSNEINNYVLILSRAGVQNFSIKLNFICTSLAQAAAGISGCHSVWILANDSFYNDAPDGCGTQAASVISAAKSANIPAYVVLTEFEQYGKMRCKNDMCAMDPSLYREILGKASNAIGETAKDATMIPVQVYGGLYFKQTSNDSDVISSAYDEYRPVGCHLPLLMTIQKINTGNKFVDNDLIRDIKMLNASQRSSFIQNGIRIEE